MNATATVTIATVATRAARRGLFALGTLAAAAAAQAVPVSVTLSGLPPGLSPTVVVQRNTCPDGMGWISNPAQALTETSVTVLERVTLPFGQTLLRTKLVTRYVASFDTPVTPANSASPLERRCSTLGINEDLFRYSVRVPGFAANGAAATLTGFVAQTGQVAGSVGAVMEAKTTSFTPIASGTLARGMTHTLDATYSTSLGTVQGQRINFLRPSALFQGLFSQTASLFVRADGAACVQAGSVTRCLGEPGQTEAGGVLLRGIQRSVPEQPGIVRFQFELMQSFGTGTVRLAAAADATDLAAYNVDGAAQTLNLLTWQAAEQTVTVQ